MPTELDAMLLAIEKLTKSYAAPDGTRSRIIDIESFNLDLHEHMALRGRSGSGKTTFLNLIAGIAEPDAGHIILAGRDLTLLNANDRDKLRAVTIGCIFQTFNLLQGYSALENVELAMLFGGGIDRAFAADLLNRVGLSTHFHHRPHQLSVGQQQRVAIARALANRPQLILADEPTGNLDAQNAREAIALIRNLASEFGAALLIVSHDESLLAGFDRVADFESLNRARQSVGGRD